MQLFSETSLVRSNLVFKFWDLKKVVNTQRMARHGRRKKGRGRDRWRTKHHLVGAFVGRKDSLHPGMVKKTDIRRAGSTPFVLPALDL